MTEFFRIPKGRFYIECFGIDGKLKWIEDFSNIVTDEGINDNLDVYFSDATQSNDWYIGLKGSAETPAAGFNSAGIGTQFTEFIAYSELTRQAWVEAGVSAKSITNSASPAIFSVNDTGTVYGAFVINVNTKSGTTGKLWCISDFGTARPVLSGDSVRITYTINAQDV